jgi:hypothetical protein
LVYSDSYKREFRKRFPCRDLLTKNELRHEEETRSGYLTALSDTITNYLNSELWKVFYSRKGKSDPCWLLPCREGNIGLNHDCETSHMIECNPSLKNTNIKTKKSM